MTISLINEEYLEKIVTEFLENSKVPWDHWKFALISGPSNERYLRFGERSQEYDEIASDFFAELKNGGIDELGYQRESGGDVDLSCLKWNIMDTSSGSVSLKVKFYVEDEAYLLVKEVLSQWKNERFSGEIYLGNPPEKYVPLISQ
ncbi:MAG: hypothetical protein AABY26_01990 [Nanoarchaeota archaeon]